MISNWTRILIRLWWSQIRAEEAPDNQVSIARNVIEHTRIQLRTWTTLTPDNVSIIILLLHLITNKITDLRMIGQKTTIERSTVEQVRERIAFLREQMKEKSAAKAFDFEKRLAEVKAKADAERAQKKAQKKAEKEKARMELLKDIEMQPENDEMAAMMGFQGFGSTKK